MDETRIINVLEAIGFNRNEIIVYLDLVKCGKSSVLNISKRTKLHRSNTYDVLEKLLKKGIVDQSIENEKKIFYPIEPCDLFDYLKQKEKELEEIIPEIEKIQNIPEENRRVALSEGINSARNILLHLLDFNEPLSVFGAPKNEVKIIGIFIEHFHRKRIKRKIPLRQIYGIETISMIKKLNNMDYTQAKYLPTLFNSDVSTNICGDKMVIIIWNPKISVITIQSENVAKCYQEYFEILWKQAEECKI